jgi:hypothetical protein
MTSTDQRNRKLVKNIVRWLCGIWALALGGRLTYTMCIHPSITIPSHPINIFFDFLLLSIFGGTVLLFELQELSMFIYSNAAKTKISVTRSSLKLNSRVKNGKE